MSLTQEQLEAIDEKVTNMTSQQRRDLLKGFVNEFSLKTIIAHIILAVYSIGMLYVNQIYGINPFVGLAQIAGGVFLAYVCILLFQALLFFRTANNIATAFDRGISNGFDTINEMDED